MAVRMWLFAELGLVFFLVLWFKLCMLGLQIYVFSIFVLGVVSNRLDIVCWFVDLVRFYSFRVARVGGLFYASWILLALMFLLLQHSARGGYLELVVLATG